jgi:hypothetical protein
VATTKEIISSVLGIETLTPNLHKVIQNNPKAFNFLLSAMSGIDANASGGGFQLTLNRFYNELSQKFEFEATPIQQMRVPRNDLSKTMKIGSEFIQYVRKVALLDISLIINNEKSSFHLLEDGNVVLIAPEVRDGFILEETDIFRIFCEKDPVNWGSLIKQLQCLGYIKNTETQKFMLFDDRGNSKPVACLALSKECAQYLFGKNLLSFAPSAYLVPISMTATTTQQFPTKKKSSDFLDS